MKLQKPQKPRLLRFIPSYEMFIFIATETNLNDQNVFQENPGQTKNSHYCPMKHCVCTKYLLLFGYGRVKVTILLYGASDCLSMPILPDIMHGYSFQRKFTHNKYSTDATNDSCDCMHYEVRTLTDQQRILLKYRPMCTSAKAQNIEG